MIVGLLARCRGLNGGLRIVDRVRTSVAMEWLSESMDVEVDVQQLDAEKQKKWEAKEARKARYLATSAGLFEASPAPRLTKTQKRLVKKKMRSEFRSERNRKRTFSRREDVANKDEQFAPEPFFFNGLCLLFFSFLL